MKTLPYIVFYLQYLHEGSVLRSTTAFLQIQYSFHCQSECCFTFADCQSRSRDLWICSHRLLSEMDLLPRLGWPCVETLGTQQPHAQLLGRFSKRNVPIWVVYGCQSSELCCDLWMSLRTDLWFDIAGILKWFHFKMCYCSKCSQYRAWSWWTVMHVKQKWNVMLIQRQ